MNRQQRRANKKLSNAALLKLVEEQARYIHILEREVERLKRELENKETQDNEI